MPYVCPACGSFSAGSAAACVACGEDRRYQSCRKAKGAARHSWLATGAVKVIVAVILMVAGVALLTIGRWTLVATPPPLRWDDWTPVGGGLLLILAALVAGQNDRRTLGALLRCLLWAYIGSLGSLAGLILALVAGHHPYYPLSLIFLVPATLLLGMIAGIVAGALARRQLNRVASGRRVGILASICAVVAAVIVGYAHLAASVELGLAARVLWLA